MRLRNQDIMALRIIFFVRGIVARVIPLPFVR